MRHFMINLVLIIYKKKVFLEMYNSWIELLKFSSNKHLFNDNSFKKNKQNRLNVSFLRQNALYLKSK